MAKKPHFDEAEHCADCIALASAQHVPRTPATARCPKHGGAGSSLLYVTKLVPVVFEIGERDVCLVGSCGARVFLFRASRLCADLIRAGTLEEQLHSIIATLMVDLNPDAD
jgi:hypothetical protein